LVSAKVTKEDKEISELSDGFFIGEMSFTTNQMASATVIASSPTRIVSWPSHELNELLAENPLVKTSLQATLGIDLVKKLSGGSLG